MNDLTTYQILCLIGVPTIILAILTYIWKKVKDNAKENKALRLGVQALLRAQMISDYNHYTEKGFAPIYARENFENCWKQYHNMGQNGVMDGIHKTFMELPTSPEQ